MQNEYYNVDKSPFHANMYFLVPTEEVCKAVATLEKQIPFSYNQIIVNLFGLEPHDFFSYIKYQYHAKLLAPKQCRWKNIYFENLKDAWDFARECDRRFAYAVNNNFFNVEV